jgi:hypothetical protein
VGLHGQPQQAVQRRVVGEPRDQRLRRLPRRLLRVRTRRRGGRRQAEPWRQLHLAVAELVDGRLVRGHPHATHAPTRPALRRGRKSSREENLDLDRDLLAGRLGQGGNPRTNLLRRAGRPRRGIQSAAGLVQSVSDEESIAAQL